MRYHHTVTATFVRRLNRFIAHVIPDSGESNGEVVVHVKNTGRCAELLLPGVKVVLEKAPEGVLRKTAYSLIAVYKGELLINIDSQAPNKVIFEAAASGQLDLLADSPICHLRAEKVFGKSRFDLYWETELGMKAFVEVKGVTLEEQGVVRFPDAPTQRGVKHVLEMAEAVKAGYAGHILFLVQMKGMSHFEPNEAMDPAFARALRQAAQAGVKILAYEAEVEPDSMILGGPVAVRLG